MAGGSFTSPSDAFYVNNPAFFANYTTNDPSTNTLSGTSGSGLFGSIELRSANGVPPNPGEIIEVWANQVSGDLYLNDGTYVGFDPSGDPNPIYTLYNGWYEVISSVAPTGPTVTYTAGPFCFLSGTYIATPTGEVLVEELSNGDIISTADGGVRKVLWIGKQTLSSTFTPAKNLPIEITIGAFGNNLPRRPLRVSPGHSLFIGDVFPIASALINDVTIRQLTKEELPETFIYYHIEVEDHALILAEGVPSETFLDASSRRAFSNWSEYVELYGEEEREVPRSDLHYKRILTFDKLPQELKETIGYPHSYDQMKTA
jgi:hypothetical protein